MENSTTTQEESESKKTSQKKQSSGPKAKEIKVSRHGLTEDNKGRDRLLFGDLDEEQAILDAIDFGDEFTENEKDNIKAKLIEERKQAFENKVSILKDEWEKAKASVVGLKQMNASKDAIKEAEKFAKKCYDAYRNFKMDRGFRLPETLFELLEIGPCSKTQKLWLLYYCNNQGNAIESCAKANVSLKTFRKWKTETDQSEANRMFSEALEEINDAITEVAEMNLKELAATKQAAALIFYLKSRHPEYKATNRLIQEEKKNRSKKAQDYSGVNQTQKINEFLVKSGKIKENYRGEDEIVQ